MLTIDDAQEKLLALAASLGSEPIDISQSEGRTLAMPLTALRTQPAADLSAMDGYAIGSGNADGPWEVIGESAAGHPFAGSVGPSEAVRISTGAVIPTGADAVLLKENAECVESRLSGINSDGPTASHIRKAGSDFRNGDVLLEAGKRLGPPQIALGIMAGHDAISVFAQPTLTVIDCGDELVSHPAEAKGAQIPATNGVMLTAMARHLVGDCHHIGPVSDSLAALQSAFAATTSEVVVISGGASVGEHDLVKPALETWGAQLAFWRVSMRPGKPLLVATKGRQIILGLPGNPVSAFVTAHLFLLPLLRKLGGSQNPAPQSVTLPIRAALTTGGSRTEFLRGTIIDGGVEPSLQRDSSSLRALSHADVLIRRDIDAPAIAVGGMVECYLLQNGAIA